MMHSLKLCCVAVDSVYKPACVCFTTRNRISLNHSPCTVYQGERSLFKMEPQRNNGSSKFVLFFCFIVEIKYLNPCLHELQCAQQRNVFLSFVAALFQLLMQWSRGRRARKMPRCHAQRTSSVRRSRSLRTYRSF